MLSLFTEPAAVNILLISSRVDVQTKRVYFRESRNTKALSAK